MSVTSALSVVLAKKLPVSLFIWVFVLVSLSISGEVRCDLQSRVNNKIGKLEIHACLEPETIKNQTIQIPSNVTRFAADKLAVCLPTGSGIPEPADVVFVIDWSGSMNGNDKEFYAPTATQEAIKLLHQISPKSTAGFVSFSGILCEEEPLGRIEVRSVREKLLDLADYTKDAYDCYDKKGGTNYYLAMNKANEMLTDPQRSRHDRKAIVFLTDGHPNRDTDKFKDMLQKGNLASVYSIFIGGDYNVLQDLAAQTGGGFFAVEPNDPDALETAMKTIISTLVAPSIPLEARITNRANGQEAAADSNGFLLEENGRYRIRLNDVVAVKQGKNEIELGYAYRNQESGKTIRNSVRFTLDVQGAVLPQGNSDLPDDFFSAQCGETRLTVTNEKFNELEKLSFYSEQFGLKFEAGTTSPENITIQVNTSLSGDSEDLGMITKGSNGKDSYDFSGQESGERGNKITEARLNDKLEFSWTHPRDPRDKVTASIQIPNGVSMPGVNPPADTFFCEHEVKLSVSTPDADIWYTTDGSKPSANQSGSRLYKSETIQIKDGMELKAIAVKPGLEDSPLFSQKYRQLELPSVSFDPPGGTYDSAQEVKLSSPIDGAEIWYTIDGSRPGPDSQGSFLYTGDPVEIKYSMDIKAMIFTQCGGPVSSVSFNVEPVAPSIKKAEFLPEDDPFRDGKNDTLRVVFEYPVSMVQSRGEFFDLENPEGEVYTFDLEVISNGNNLGDTILFLIREIKGVDNPSTGDNIQLIASVAEDPAGNLIEKQNPDNNQLVAREPDIISGVNPGEPVANMDEQTQNAFGDARWLLANADENITITQSGENIKQVSRAEVDEIVKAGSANHLVLKASQAFEIEVSVYSHLGHFMNSIKFALPPEQYKPENETEGEFILLWSGKSKKGIAAGNGVYIFRVVMKTISPFSGRIIQNTKMYRLGLTKGNW